MVDGMLQGHVVSAKEAGCWQRYFVQTYQKNWSQSPPRWAFALVTWLCGLLERLLDRLIPPPQRALQRALAFIDSHVIFTCMKLSVAEALQDGPKSSTLLAKELNVGQDAIQRLLLTAVQAGFFKCKHDANGEVLFSNNSLSLVLHKDHHSQLTPMFGHLSEEIMPAFMHLEHALKSSHVPAASSAFAEAMGLELWDFYAAHPERSERFTQAMRAIDGLGAQALVEDHKWAQYSRILDIGGASGSFLATILKGAPPETTGVLCDLQSVVEVSRQMWASRPDWVPIAERLSFANIDFLMPGNLPQARDGDCYLMRQILHDWNDQDAELILRNVRQAMGGARATLAIVEMSLMDNRQGVLANAQRKADMSMMCMLKGRERSRAQWEALFAACGFKPLHVKGTRTPFYIITAEPV